MAITGRRALGAALGLFARAWTRSLRLRLVADPSLAETNHTPWVLAFWHGEQFVLHAWQKRRKTAVLVSLSSDGDIQAAALPRLGLLVERGSSSKQGATGLKGIVRRLREGNDAAFAVDGPRGPRCVIRGDGDRVGAILAARLGRALVVPLASACAKSWVLKKTWDQFELPVPFSRVAIALGAPLDPHRLDGATLAQALTQAGHRARAALRSDP